MFVIGIVVTNKIWGWNSQCVRQDVQNSEKKSFLPKQVVMQINLNALLVSSSSCWNTSQKISLITQLSRELLSDCGSKVGSKNVAEGGSKAVCLR